MYPDDDLMRQAMIAQLRGQQAPQPPPDQPPPQPQGLSRQRAVGLLALLTGNRQMGGIGDALVGNANQQEKFQQIDRPNAQLSQARAQQEIQQAGPRFASEQRAAQLAQTRTQQEIEQAGPQAALGGQTPSTFDRLTKRLEVPKAVQAGQFPGSLDQRTGKFTPYANADGSPMTDVHTQREREKRKASLNVGPDLEPSDDLMNKVENGLADPKSPGMEGPLKKLATLNSAAGGFADVAQQLKDFYVKHPNGALTGTDATKAEAIAQDLRSLYMENLNMQTLRSSDIPILDKVIADPSSLKSMFASGTGIRDLSAQLDTAVNLAKQRTLSQASALGYQPTKKGRFAGFQQRTDQGGAGGAGPAAPHPQDQQAVDWAKAHPADPRSAAILKANGAQ